MQDSNLPLCDPCRCAG